MALVSYHCQLDTVSRSKGHSATAAAAYRSGELVMDERTGIVHDYTRRGGVEHTEIFLPENAPEWASNRSELWNAAEQSETRKNSTVAREFKLAFPAALTPEQRLETLRSFCGELVQRHGVAVDAAMHAPDRSGDQRNFHAHVLFSTRALSADGFGAKTRELDDIKTGKVLTVEWKSRWANLCAEQLKTIGHGVEAERWRHGHELKDIQLQRAAERGDKEYVRENADRVVTKHIGPNVIQMEQRGIQTERMQEHRDTEKRNAQIINLAEMRDRIQEARARHERSDERGGRDQQSDRVLGRTAAGRSEDRRAAAQLDIGRAGRVPPTIARGRLRNLSELSVVRFAGRSEMLLPRDVPGQLEHQGTQHDHALRRQGNELTEKPLNAREQVQRELNADLLRRALDHSAKGHEQQPPQATTRTPTPQEVKAEWKAEIDKQFAQVATRAQSIHARANVQFERQEKKLQAHDRTRPEEPAGFFAGLKKAAHDQALSIWQGARKGLERRFLQLQARVNLLGQYMRKAGSYELQTKGERLAEKLAEKARPELANSFRDVTEREKAEKIAQARAKFEQRQGNNQERSTMKMESIEELKARTDANREKAEAAERKELENAGMLASAQNAQEQNAEQKQATNEVAQGQGEALAKYLNRDDKEAKKLELLEKFKEKAARDRDNDRGRGR